MKAQDLMIGDWISYGVKPVQVLQLSNTEYKGFEPIPLTPEILEKNGFGYVENDDLMGISHFYQGAPYYCTNTELHIGSNNKGRFWMNYLNNSVVSIHYVHELQHALRLCGIDLEIKL